MRHTAENRTEQGRIVEEAKSHTGIGLKEEGGKVASIIQTHDIQYKY